MDARLQKAMALEARAAAAPTLAEAQALHDAADRMRGSLRRDSRWVSLPLYRN